MSFIHSCGLHYNIKHVLSADTVAIPLQHTLSIGSFKRFLTNSLQNNKIKKESCKTLGLSENYSSADLKNTFLKLAKLYHPDSGSKYANAEKFSEIESAYRILKGLDHSDTTNFDEVYQTLEKDFGIKHSVPQHRQFLSYDGVGYGNPSQRERQYRLSRVDKATQNVYEHKVKKINVSAEKEILFRDAALSRQYQTRQAMERLVEDLIQASMARGEFDNLPGSGKPLKQLPENPYVDTTTHKLNQILISNGFTPEWIVLQKEIKEERLFLKDTLRKRWAQLGKVLSTETEIAQWISTLTDLKEDIAKLNGRIDKFNMIVPTLNKQQIHFHLETETKKVLQEDKDTVTNEKAKKECNVSKEDTGNIFSGILNFINSNRS